MYLGPDTSFTQTSFIFTVRRSKYIREHTHAASVSVSVTYAHTDTHTHTHTHTHTRTHAHTHTHTRTHTRTKLTVSIDIKFGRIIKRSYNYQLSVHKVHEQLVPKIALPFVICLFVSTLITCTILCKLYITMLAWFVGQLQ